MRFIIYSDLGANRLGTLNKDAFKGMIQLNELYDQSKHYGRLYNNSFFFSDLFDNQIEYLPMSIFDSLENLINL